MWVFFCMAQGNPHGANQYQPDPRQTLFLSYYLDPKSKTFSNALQSALKAGYSQETSESITSNMPSWLSESLGDNLLVKTAEKNLLYFLTETKDEKLKQDTTKFVSERLNKKKYSSRNELTGKDGEQLQGNTIVLKNFKDAADRQ